MKAGLVYSLEHSVNINMIIIEFTVENMVVYNLSAVDVIILGPEIFVKKNTDCTFNVLVDELKIISLFIFCTLLHPGMFW